MLLIPSISNAQKYDQKQNVDTLYSVSTNNPVMLFDNISKEFYMVKKQKKVKVAKVQYKYGTKKLEEYLRMMYYKDFSQEFSAVAISYILIFNSCLHLKKVEIVQCPKFLASDKVRKRIEKWLSNQSGNWYCENKNYNAYFYFGRLLVL